MPVLMLQALPIERCSTRGAAQQKSAGTEIARRPTQIADSLKAKHRIINIKRHQRLRMIGVRGCSRQPGSKCAPFIDPLFHNLTVLVFTVRHNLTRIDGLVELPHARINTQLPEHALHPKRSRFIGYNWNNPFTEMRVFH